MCVCIIAILGRLSGVGESFLVDWVKKRVSTYSNQNAFIVFLKVPMKERSRSRRLWHRQSILTSWPFCWRCRTPLATCRQEMSRIQYDIIRVHTHTPSAPYLPHSLSHALSTLLASQQSTDRVSSPHVPFEKKGFFPGFLRIFPPSFLVREDPILLSSVDTYCCTYREDVGNRLPLCEG